MTALLMASSSIVTAQTIEPNAGAYLAGRHAGQIADFEHAARHYMAALRRDPTHPAILENTLTANFSLAEFNTAVEIADAMVALDINRQMPNIVLAAHAARTDNWTAIFSAHEKDHRIGPVVDGLSQGWAHMALGEFDKAMMSFDEVSETSGLQSFGVYHKALALASVGDFDEAIRIFDLTTAGGGLRHNRRSAMAHAQILSQLDRREDAVALLDAVFGNTLDPRLQDLHNRISTGGVVPYDVVTSPIEGMSEIFLAVAEALRGDAPDNYTLVYARASEYLTPNNTETCLLYTSPSPRDKRQSRMPSSA